MDLFQNYKALLQKVDESTQAVHQRAKDALKCHEGCSSCCAKDLHVTKVEADYIVQNVQASNLVLNHEEGCVFLDLEGACQVYDFRPILCRTHGYALVNENPTKSKSSLKVHNTISWCDLNYQDREPTQDEIIDTGRLDQMRFIINQLYIQSKPETQDSLRGQGSSDFISLDQVAKRLLKKTT